jgi:hypothetical protein
VWAEADAAPGFAGRQQWTVTGRIRAPVTIPPPIDFGRHSVAERRVLPMSVKLATHHSVKSVSAQSLSPDFMVHLEPGSPDEAGDWLVVTPSQRLPTGKYRGEAVLAATLHSGERLPPQSLPLELEIAPDLEATPGLIQFGCQDVGTEATEVVTVGSLASRVFTVESATAEGAGITIAPANDDCSYVVRMRVTSAGLQEGRVRLTIRTKAGDVERLEVPVRAHGYPKEP